MLSFFFTVEYLNVRLYKVFYDMLFSLYSQIKLILLFILYIYITVVSLLLYDGPDDALLYFVLTTTPVWRSGQRAGLITLRSGVRITSPVFTRFIGSFACFIRSR